MRDLVADYLQTMRARGLSPRTIALTQNVLDMFATWSPATDWSQLSQRDLDNWSAHLLTGERFKGAKVQKALSRESVRTYMRTLSSFIKWAQAEDAISAKLKARQPVAEHRLLEVLSRAEITRMEDAAGIERDKLIIRLLADTGIRLGELLGLRADDLIEQGRERYIKVRGKGQRDRLVPLAPQLYTRLQRYARRSGARIFVTSRRSPKTHEFEPLASRSVQNMIAFNAVAAGIERHVHPHLFRHSFATHALRKNMNPLALQRILGHADLSMISGVYAHLTPSDSYAAMLELVKADD